MKTLVVNLPSTVDLSEKDLLTLIAARLFERGTLSLGQAADLVGLSKRAFMETLGSHGVSVFNCPPSELERDIANAKDYSF